MFKKPINFLSFELNLFGSITSSKMKVTRLLLLFAVYLMCTNISVAQIIIPEFEEPNKVEELSSSEVESMPIPFNNGEEMYYYVTVVKGEGLSAKQKDEHVWYSERKKGKWKVPYRLFNAAFIENKSAHIIGTDSTGERIYLYFTEYTKEGSVEKLGYYDKEGRDKWSEFHELTIPNFKFEEKYYSFYITPNEDILLISMSPSTTHLDEDLYVCLKQEDGSWGEIIDLGKTINTPKLEVSPYIAPDGKTLYFASDGHGGFGAEDIFVSYRLDDSWKRWSKPLNLGEPINSASSDEFFIYGNGEEVYFSSDRNSDHLNIYTAKATGEVKFANIDSVGGQFFYKGLPKENITLKILDSNGDVVDEIVTDAFGRFTYQKLDPDESYVIKLAADDDENYVGSKIYFVNEDGKKTNRYILTEDGVFADASDINTKESIRGVFKYNELPMSNSALVILDENGFPVDTIYTDENGKFEYEKLVYDQDYSVIPLNLEEDNWVDAEIYLTDLDGNKTQEFILRKDQFVFTEVVEDQKMVEIAEADQAIVDDTEEIIGKAEVNEAWNGKSGDVIRVYFDFARSNPNGLKKMNDLIEYLKNNATAQIVVEGHTDSIGTIDNNQALGQKRAQAVGDYLKTKGVPDARMQITSKGESEPIESNMYKDGRAKNRRVEIILK